MTILLTFVIILLVITAMIYLSITFNKLETSVQNLAQQMEQRYTETISISNQAAKSDIESSKE